MPAPFRCLGFRYLQHRYTKEIALFNKFLCSALYNSFLPGIRQDSWQLSSQNQSSTSIIFLIALEEAASATKILEVFLESKFLKILLSLHQPCTVTLNYSENKNVLTVAPQFNCYEIQSIC